MRWLVTVRSNRDDPSPQIPVEFQNLCRWLPVRQTIAHRRCIHLDALAIRNDDLQNLFNEILHLVKGIPSFRVIPRNQIHVSQHTVIFEALHHPQHLPVVCFIELPPGPSLQELPVPELLVSHLVNGQNRKVQGIFLRQCLKLRDGVRLHPQLQTPADPDPVPIFLLHVGDFRKITGIIHIGHGLPVSPDNLLPAVPVHLDSVIHMIRETQLLQPQPDGICHHILHGIHRVIRKFTMHMIVRLHSQPLLFSFRVHYLHSVSAREPSGFFFTANVIPFPFEHARTHPADFRSKISSEHFLAARKQKGKPPGPTPPGFP